jgi:hypothetical protein
MKPVLAFLRLSTNTSLGLFWTLVQVLLHTNLVQLSLAAPSSSWVSVYVPSGKSTRIHAYALIIVNLDGDCVHISKLTYLTSPNRKGV